MVENSGANSGVGKGLDRQGKISRRDCGQRTGWGDGAKRGKFSKLSCAKMAAKNPAWRISAGFPGGSGRGESDFRPSRPPRRRLQNRRPPGAAEAQGGLIKTRPSKPALSPSPAQESIYTFPSDILHSIPCSIFCQNSPEGEKKSPKRKLQNARSKISFR